MARPVTISDERILNAARTAFLKSGIHASTKEIARLAKVSEGTLFHRFATREALFRAAMADPPFPEWVNELERLIGTGDARANLTHIAAGIISFSQRIVPMFILAWGNRPDNTNQGINPGQQLALRDRDRFTNYLRGEVQLGRLNVENVEALSAALFSACTGFVLDGLALQETASDNEITLYARNLIAIFWDGIAPKPSTDSQTA